MYYIFLVIWIIIFIYIVRLWQINKNLKLQEQQIVNLFNTRTNMIPAIFDMTKIFFTKHDEIFEKILKYRKQELYKYYLQDDNTDKDSEFHKLIYIEELIHNELNFIFRIANKHPKLTKKWNFIYVRELIIKKSVIIWNIIKNYKIKTKLYNKLVLIKYYKKHSIDVL